MIGWLQGQVVEKQQPGKIILNVNGVGYDVETSLQSFFQLENLSDIISLHIHTVVREDALLLYGFLDIKERSLFRELIKVNGIGPKAAINILSSVSPQEFIQAIEQQNAILLTKLPGIGKKTAERLVIEMKDRISNLFTDIPLAATDSNTATKPLANDQDEAISALLALGYKAQEASRAVKQVNDGSLNCEQMIRQALSLLARR